MQYQNVAGTKAIADTVLWAALKLTSGMVLASLPATQKSANTTEETVYFLFRAFVQQAALHLC